MKQFNANIKVLNIPDDEYEQTLAEIAEFIIDLGYRVEFGLGEESEESE